MQHFHLESYPLRFPVSYTRVHSKFNLNYFVSDLFGITVLLDSSYTTVVAKLFGIRAESKKKKCSCQARCECSYR